MANTQVVSRLKCKVAIDELKTFADHTEQSPRRPHTFMHNQQLVFSKIVDGQDINRSGHHTNKWGYQAEGNFYFWLGGVEILK